MNPSERSLAAVPRAVWLVLLIALGMQITWQAAQPKSRNVFSPRLISG